MTDDIPIKLKHTIKDLRVRAGLSQSEASKRLGITEPTLRKWEKDSSVLSFRQMNEITDLYQIPLEYIFWGNENVFSEK